MSHTPTPSPPCVRLCVCFGEIDIFFLLLFSRIRVSAGFSFLKLVGVRNEITQFRPSCWSVGGRWEIHNPCVSAKGLACMRAQSLCVWVNNSEVGMNRDERGRVDEWRGKEWAEKLDVNAIAIVRFFARFTAPN